MKKIILIFSIFVSSTLFAQSNRSDLDQQIKEIMKAREEMLKSLLEDSAFENFDSRFEDLVKRFQQSNFDLSGMSGFTDGPIVGEYDWRETATHQIFVLKVKQIKDRPLDIKIEKGRILLKGDVESVRENTSMDKKKTKQISKVHFERSFSIPDGVDQANPTFDNKDGELLIKFKKHNERLPLPKGDADTVI